nr:MAG TPA: hypothetical protein [Caudoviricetes sp.]
MSLNRRKPLKRNSIVFTQYYYFHIFIFLI